MIIAGFPKLFPIVSLTSGDPPRKDTRRTDTHAKKTDKRTDNGKGDDEHNNGNDKDHH